MLIVFPFCKHHNRKGKLNIKHTKKMLVPKFCRTSTTFIIAHGIFDSNLQNMNIPNFDSQVILPTSLGNDFIAKRWCSLWMIMTKIIIMMIIVSAQGWVFSPGGDQGGSEGKVLHSVTQPTPLDLTSRSTAKLSHIQQLNHQRHCNRIF